MSDTNNAVATRDEYLVTTAVDKGWGVTKDGKQIVALDREGFVNNALSFIDWENADSRTSTRGDYKTTGQCSFYVEDAEGNTLQINFSANFFPKDRQGTKKSTKEPAEQLFHLNEGELVALDKFASELAATDLPGAARLMTIREVHKMQGGISKEQIKTAWAALESAGVK